jgi:hypothetical protein
MDDFSALFFSEPDYPQDLPIEQRPEIQDAIARVLLRKGILKNYRVELSKPFSTNNPHIQCIHIRILCTSEVPLFFSPIRVWIDDFELRFTFLK